MTITTHKLTLVNSFLDDGVRAVCSCGWDSSLVETNALAVDVWENHTDNVFERSTEDNERAREGLGFR